MSLFHLPVLLFVAAFSFSLWQLIATTFSFTQDMRFFAGGFVLAVVYNIVWNRKEMWDAFWHELTHLLWMRVFFIKATYMFFTKKGDGGVKPESMGKFRFLFIILAPYFFPLLPLLLIVIKKFVYLEYLQFVSAIVGFYLSLYYADQLKALFAGQSDIARVGRIKSTITILIMHSFFLAVIAISILDQHAFTEYFTVAAVNLIEKINPPVGGLDAFINGN